MLSAQTDVRKAKVTSEDMVESKIWSDCIILQQSSMTIWPGEVHHWSGGH